MVEIDGLEIPNLNPSDVLNNMVGGCTTIVTLTKDAWKMDDELKSCVLQAMERASIQPAQSYEGCSEEFTEESNSQVYS